MAPSSAFQLHEKISKNARNQLTSAISLDERNLKSEALASYKKAQTLLRSYIQAFTSTAPGFLKLSHAETRIVTNTRATFNRHLQSITARVQNLTRPQQGIPRSPPSNHAYRPPPQRATVADASDPLRQAIESDILDSSPKVDWDDIYGLEEAKNALHEMVVLPAQRPDLYKGLRAPGRGVLLFGPPGTGKTMIAKAVASNADATFFSISASSLNSKFHGESERLVRALFAVARERQPAFIFIDEVDSILGVRSESEHEASRRLKTEFMSQFDGVGGADDRVYVMAASNRPQDLDDAVRRRLDRRIYIGLPNREGRKHFLKKVTQKNEDVRWALTEGDFARLAQQTERFSGSDIKALCREASLMPLRELGHRVSDISATDVRGCKMSDFEEALGIVRPSSEAGLVKELEKWNEKFGSKARKEQVSDGDPGDNGSNKRKPGSLKAHQSRKTTTAQQNTRSVVLRPFNLRKRTKP